MSIDSLFLISLKASHGVHAWPINNADGGLGIKSACSKLLFHLHPPLFYFCCHSQKFWSLRKAIYCIYFMAEEGKGFSLGRDNYKVRISGKLVFMTENFILLLPLLGAKNIVYWLLRSHMKYKIGLSEPCGFKAFISLPQWLPTGC